ncbi:uncharacterized protein MEPE_02171 [Melanopsichium pennsylvanicum]|uniref:Uncharacterized protein n=1 Tax=Melanopsichium pennsylvanicum TaxID=63383 RepID=A0AAJ4XJE7_9BASI|nr:uncharacterized protein MEPE_02171 [Melanopsichium pennsylvanicum]
MTPPVRLSLQDIDSIQQHLNDVIEAQDGSISNTPQDMSTNQKTELANAALYVTQAIRQVLSDTVPLQDAHKKAIHSFLDDVFEALDNQAARHDDTSSDGGSITPPSRRSAMTFNDLSPTRQQAAKASESFFQLKREARNDLTSTFSTMSSFYIAAASETAASKQKRFERLILRFLDVVEEHQHALAQIFPDLTTVNPTTGECSSNVKDALKHLHKSEITSPDWEQIAYVLLRLPYRNEQPLRADNLGELESHFANQLRRNYRGDAPFRFLQFVLEVNRQRTEQALQAASRTSIPDDNTQSGFNAYLKMTSLVQSSGTGKTRLVLELGKVAPLLYTCLRRKAPDERPSVVDGYPLGDTRLYTYFSRSKISRPTPNSASATAGDAPVLDILDLSTVSYDLQVAAFVGGWFQTLATELRFLSDAQAKHKYLQKLNDFDGADSTASTRSKFFMDVVRAAEDLIWRYRPLDQRGSVPSDVFGPCLDSPALALSEQLQPVRQWLAQDKAETYRSLGTHELPVFVAVDECVELIIHNPARRREKESSNDQLESLRRAFNYLLGLESRHKKIVSFWLVLLSTSTGAATLIKPKELQGSTRALTKEVMPIFVGMGFDVLRSEQGPLRSPADVSTLEHVRSYGRPLWSSLHDNSFWEVAQAKLFGKRTVDEASSVVCYNVLASRLALRLVPVHDGDTALFGEQKTLGTQSIDRHMRMLEHVAEDSSSFSVNAPSEPVLAVAAALAMLSDSPQLPGISTGQNSTSLAYVKIMKTFTTQSLAALGPHFLKGTGGEFLTRCVMMAACDAVKLPLLQGNLANRASNISRPVEVGAFIHKLAQLDGTSQKAVTERVDTVCSLVHQRLGANSTANKEDVQAWLNFSHFDELPEVIADISPDYLWYCWKRGVAIQMAHKQPGVDGIIPVFVGQLSSKFVSDATQESQARSDGDAPGTWSSGAARMTPFDAGAIHECEAARQMTFIAWESKFRKDALGGEDASKDALTGPPLLPPACDASKGEPRSKLTKFGLLTVLADLGTEQAFQDTRLQTRAETITTRGKGHQLSRLWIRGLSDVKAYPCLDDLEIREQLLALRDGFADIRVYEQYNLNPHPLWNAGAKPDEMKPVVEGPSLLSSWPSPPGSSVISLEQVGSHAEPMDQS